MSENNETELKYPKIGLAIGSGAAKAICQMGVLKRMVEQNVKLSYLIGSSAGGVIAGFYALGLDINEAIEKSLDFLQKNNIAEFGNMNFFHESIFEKDFTKAYLKKIFGDAKFEDCKIPFAVTAVDLESGKEVLINKGYLWEGIRASTAIPGAFEPVFLDEHYLIDGALIDDTPYTAIRKYTDCDIIVASTIFDLVNKQFISAAVYQKFYQKDAKMNGFWRKLSLIRTDLKLFTEIVTRAVNILREYNFESRLKEARPDVMIKIYSDKVTMFEFSQCVNLIKEGANAFDAKYPELKKLIDQKIMELNDLPKNVNLQVHYDGGWTK